MRILFKLDFSKFSVSNLFFSKVIKEKPLGGLGKEELISLVNNNDLSN